MKKCPNCNMHLEDEVKFCTNCGTNVEYLFTCPKCGKSLEQGTNFCAHCGLKIEEGTISDTKIVQSEESLEEQREAERRARIREQYLKEKAIRDAEKLKEKEENQKAFFTLILIICIVAISTAVYFFFFHNSQSNSNDKLSVNQETEAQGSSYDLDNSCDDYDSDCYDDDSNDTQYNGYEFVDLGFPSGTKWATMNIGAQNPSDCGDFFQWGGLSSIFFDNGTPVVQKAEHYRFIDNDNSCFNKMCYSNGLHYSKYYPDIDTVHKCAKDTIEVHKSGDYKTRLELCDDAARELWGGKWRLPTSDEIEELINNCTIKWDYDNRCYYLKSHYNGNTLVLPMYNKIDEECCMWSSDIDKWKSEDEYLKASTLETTLHNGRPSVGHNFALRVNICNIRPVFK